MNFLFALTLIACVIFGVDGARILVVFPHQARSHYNVYEPLLKRLAEKGHQVVSVSHFPQKTPLANLTDVDVSSSLPSLIGTMTMSQSDKVYKWLKLKSVLENRGSVICDPVLSHPGLRKIVQSREKFDVYIVEIFVSDCFLSIAHVLEIPIVIGTITSVTVPWANDVLRNPEIPSYIPNWFSSYTDRMNFFERFGNSVDFFVTKLAYRYLSDNPSYEIAKKHFGNDLPDFDTLRSKISLILTNGHPVISTPRAVAPGFKELGGIHIPPSGPQPLPKHLQDFLDAQGNDGVIYFSLGSQINSSTMSNQVFAAFYKAFEQVPQQILWKCSEEKMPRLAKNVKCIEWAPQLSILYDYKY
ncbi:Ecdysteroid UDP-glucosyltransferase [Habropoda laboriosa]|uniref:Ecdysteroid UDP-glucosyltransferase n=1 Tax=Habropoda laboriosa TaxID=597456 RepID=A0A0L7QTD3_9HYME|nr:PREDICTED: UDP-glucuronosyltransferase 2B30-like [Habropoda laboriosa]KOC61875.1 Ecdysteroid UDP-glucosyltransferase [Habropoda laboriosa]